VLSAFAFLGIYYFVHLILEVIFCNDIGDVVTLVPVLSKDVPLQELLRTVNTFSSGGTTVVVDMNHCLSDGEELTQKGLCNAIVEPEKLGETLLDIIH
jgi:hypothetical protein